MTEKEIVFDLMMEAEGFQLSDDARFDEYDYVRFLFEEKRARTIRDAYRRNGTIYSETVQNLYSYDVTKVNGADDPNIQLDCELGKVTIPDVIGFHDDTEEFSGGIRRVNQKNGKNRYYQTSPNKFSDIVDLGGLRGKFDYFFTVGNELFIYPYRPNINISAILERPLEGFVSDTENKTTLVIGDSYTVRSGSITHSATTYQEGDIFTATATTFSGSGEVGLTNSKRAMTRDDRYPFSNSMMKQVKAEFYNGEFRLQQITQADGRNDSTDNQVKQIQG